MAAGKQLAAKEVITHSRSSTARIGWTAAVAVFAGVLLAAGERHGAVRQNASAARATQATDESQAPLVCRVVDSSAQPVVGATVEFVYVLTSRIKSYFGASAYSQVGAQVHEAVERTVAAGKTDENGEFTALLPLGRAFEVRAHVEGRVAKVETNRYAGERVEVVMYRPGAIEGHVRSSIDAKPITSGRVCPSMRVGWSWTHDGAVAISADGTYRVEGLLPGWYTTRPEWTWEPSDGFELAEGETQTVNLTVEPPLPTRTARSGSNASKSRRTDLSVRTVRGRLVDPDGRPAGHVYVAAVFQLFGTDTGTFELRETKSTEDGSFELKDLDAGNRHTLCAWSEGWAPLFFDMPADERLKDDWDVGVLGFVRAGELTGTVVASDGSPLPGVGIRLFGISEPQKEPNGPDGKPLRFAWSYRHFRDGRSLHTDEHGRFVVIDLAPGRYSVTFSAKRMHNDFTAEVEVIAGCENPLGQLEMPNFLDPH